MNNLAISSVEIFLVLCRIYIAIGLIFAVLFVIFWVQKVDPAAQGGTIGFRILIIPGVCAFWPMFVWRLVQGKVAPTEINSHRLRAVGERSNE